MRRDALKLLIVILAGLTTGPVCAQLSDPSPAPDQHPQPLYFTAHPSLFTIPDASRAFETNVYPREEFLPEEVYESDSSSALFEEDEFEKHEPIELAQYPMVDSLARDEDDTGHYPQSRWNPVPALTEKLANLPEQKRGLQMKDFAMTDSVILPSGDSYAMNTLDVRGKFYFGRAPFLLFSPRFGYHNIFNNELLPMPNELYDTGLDTTLVLPLNERWIVMTTVGPSFFSDGKNTTSDAFRMTASVLAFYTPSERIKLAGGFIYLDRNDIRALPVAGLIYAPSPDIKVEVLFPRPKVAYRFYQDGQNDAWIYGGGEFGGSSWAIQHANGVNDTMTLRDFRLMSGVEYVAGKRYRALFEVGYVFGRKVEFASNLGNFDQSPTGIVRAGCAF